MALVVNIFCVYGAAKSLFPDYTVLDALGSKQTPLLVKMGVRERDCFPEEC